MRKSQITALIVLFLLLVGASTYSIFSAPTSEKILIEYQEEIVKEQNNITRERMEREKKKKAWQELDSTLSGSINESKARIKKLQLCIEAKTLDCETETKKLSAFIENSYAESEHEDLIPPLDSGTATDEPAIVHSSDTGNHCTIGTGSHDVRHLAPQYPGVAGWKNNNTSGITMGSKALEQAFDDADIQWYVGTARPANEGSWYYGFSDLENGLKAKMLVIRRSYTGLTISQFLTRWGTDYIPTAINTSRTVGSLTDSELIELILEQIKKESGTPMRDYIRDNVIVCG